MKDEIKLPFIDGLPTTKLSKEHDENIEHLRAWLSYQPHLPTLTDEHLHLFLHSCYDDLESSKKTIESYFTMKTMSPELFSNRDPLGGDVQQGLDISEFALLPGKTHDGYRVVFYRLSDTTTNKFVHLSITKAFFMVNDMWLSEVGLADGYVAIFDMKGFSLGHLARISLSVMSKYMFYIQDCHPARLKSIHVINSSSFVDKVLALIKPFMRSGMMDMLHFHGPVESISDVVPLDILPQEYNGKAPSMGELHADMRRLLEGRYIDWFSLEEKLRVDETKRTGKSPVADTIFGVEGSFRKLDID